MKIGSLRHRVGLLARAKTLDAFGQDSEVFTLQVTVWGNVSVNPLQETEAYEGTVGKEAITVTIRPIKTITLDSKLSWNGNLYNIISIVDVNGRMREHELIAERIR